MSYTAYERNTNTVIELVAEHCKHLTTNGIFNTSSIPKLASVEAWIDQAHFDIQTHLAKAGYDTVVADADTAVLGYLENLNVYGAVVQVELSRPVSGRDGEGNERWQEYKKLYEEGLTNTTTSTVSINKKAIIRTIINRQPHNASMMKEVA